MEWYGTLSRPVHHLFRVMPYHSNLRESIATLAPDVQAHILQLQADSDQLRQLIPEDPGEDLRLLCLLGMAVTSYLAQQLSAGTDPDQPHRVDLLRGFYERVGDITYFITQNQVSHG